MTPRPADHARRNGARKWRKALEAPAGRPLSVSSGAGPRDPNPLDAGGPEAEDRVTNVLRILIEGAKRIADAG